MARVIEIEGKTIDEALYHGLDQLALTIDEVDMEVLDYGSKGFMGIGYKPVKIKLSEREEAVIPDFVLNKDKPKEKAPRKDRREKPRREKVEKEETEEIKGEYFPEDTEFVENEVTEFQKGLMDHVGIQNGSVKAANTDNGLLVNLEGDDMGVLIGRRGETLDAVQYLASLVYNKDKEDYHRITVDTEN